MNEAAKRFFSSARFAVAGASADKSKFGFKCCSPSSLYNVDNWLTNVSVRMVPRSRAARPACDTISVVDQRSLNDLSNGFLGERALFRARHVVKHCNATPHHHQASSRSQRSRYQLCVDATRYDMRLCPNAQLQGTPPDPVFLGSFDDESLQYAKKEFKAAVGGFEDNPGNGGEGWCVLVDGDDAIFRAKEDKAGGKL